jgi:hypothetical protein
MVFGKAKSLPQKAEDEKAKLQMKAMKVQNANLDRQLIMQKRMANEELRRLQA